jgi:hypothetical protein
VAVLRLLPFAQPWFVSHRGIDLLQQKRRGGVLGRQVDNLDVGLAEAKLLEHEVKVIQLDAAAQDGD